jgi:hypothetical protein
MVKGRVEYTNRAFRQDSQEAMQDDIVRGLVELITNADDVYGESGGAIKVSLINTDNPDFPVSVMVSDSATGLNREGLERRLTKAGELNDEFVEGKASRGLLGRGAKDVAAFGFVKFETVKEGKYSWLIIDLDGETELCDDSKDASQELRARLGIESGQSGLTASIFVRKEILSKLPSGNKLFERLCNTAQLRDLTSRSTVQFDDQRKTRLTRQVKFDSPSSTVRLSKEITIPGFEKVAWLELSVLEQPGRTKAGEETPNGILVKSGKTIYQNSMFGKDSHPFATHITGFVIAEEINDIIRASDERGQSQLISRNRNGLIKNHEYTQALTRAVLAELDQLLDDLDSERGEGSGQGDSLTKALEDARKLVVRELNELLSEIDTETDGVVPFDDSELVIIPGKLYLAPNTSGTLTVQMKSGQEATVFSDVGTGVGLISVEPHSSGWRGHKRSDLNLVTTTLLVRAGGQNGLATLRVTVGSHTRVIEVLVREAGNVDAPVKLEFRPARASISPSRNRHLVLRAPLTQIDSKVEVTLTSDSEAALQQNEVTLRPTTDWRWVQALVSVSAGTKIGSARIQALADNGETAECELSIRDTGIFAGVDLDFKVVRGETPSARALAFNPEGVIEIRIQGDNEINKKVLGAYSKSENRHANEESPDARLMIAELLSRALAEYLVDRDAENRPALWVNADAQRYISQINNYAERFAKYFYAALRSD